MRPEKISKLAMYTQIHEPLVYLFIINTDFVEDDGTVLGEFGMAGVTTRNKRIKFFYNSRLLGLVTEELFFVVLHEAYHIFKKHLTRFPDLQQENMTILNIAQDVVINEEIAALPMHNSTTGIKPKILDSACRVEPEYLALHEKLGPKESLTTRRLYNYLYNKKINKKDLLKKGSFVRIKGTDKYGKITNTQSSKGEDYYEVDVMSKDDFKEEVMGGKGAGSYHNQTFHEDELIPVVRGRDTSDKGKPVDFDIEVIDPIDVHIKQDELDDIEQEVLAKKIFEQAKDMEKKAGKSAGSNEGHFTKSIEDIFKSKVNWKKELNKHLNVFTANNCMTKTTRPSFITYPWNPKSRYGILCKHTISEVGNKQKFIIIGVDTSGSVFYDKQEMATFFTEVDALAKWFEFTKEGTVLTVQWDAKIAEGIKIYRKGDWKTYDLKGGGGTIPHALFEYLTEIYKKKGNRYIVNENDVKFIIDEPKKLPFVIVLTDGYFYSPFRKKDLGIYKDCHKNVLFFTKQDNYIGNDLKRIVYEG